MTNFSYRLVVFDWEGTLGDTLGQILSAIAVEAERLQFGKLDEQNARQWIGLGLAMALRKLFPALLMHQHEQLLQAVNESLSLMTRSTQVYLMPGSKHIIQQIQQTQAHLAIATNKGHQSLQRALQACGLDAFFDVTRSAGQVPPKPCPQMLEEIMDECGVSAAETLMIGDSVTDIQMAKALDVAAIGMDFYHQQEDALRAAGALEVFDNFKQLADYLNLSNLAENQEVNK